MADEGRGEERAHFGDGSSRKGQCCTMGPDTCGDWLDILGSHASTLKCDTGPAIFRTGQGDSEVEEGKKHHHLRAS